MSDTTDATFTSESFAETLIGAISKCAETGEPHNIKLTVDTGTGARKVVIAVCPEDMLEMLGANLPK